MWSWYCDTTTGSTVLARVDVMDCTSTVYRIPPVIGCWIDWWHFLQTRSVDVCVVCTNKEQRSLDDCPYHRQPPSFGRNAYVPNTAKSSVTYQHLVRGVLRGTSFRNLTRGNSTHCMTVHLDSWTTTVNVLPSIDTPTAHPMIHTTDSVRVVVAS